MCRDPPGRLHRWGAFFADKDVKKKRNHANVDSWQKPDLAFRRIPEGRAAAKQVLTWLKAGGETATSPGVSAAGVTRTSERMEGALVPGDLVQAIWRSPLAAPLHPGAGGDRQHQPQPPAHAGGHRHPTGMWEGCLSVPGLRWQVERWQLDRWLTVRLACRDGETMAGGMGKPVTGFEPATY